MASTPIPFSVRVIDGTVVVGSNERDTVVVQEDTIRVVRAGTFVSNSFSGLNDTLFTALATDDLAQFNGTVWVNVPTSSVGVTSHLALTDIGVNTHAAIDTHIADGTIHFLEGSIDHTAITNIGVNSHVAIDTHIADGTIHFLEGSIDHTAITNIGVNSHATIDTHIADGTIHFADAPADSQTYARRDNAWVEIGTGSGLLSGVWRFSTSTTPPPASGRFQFDTGAFGTVTEIDIHDFTRPGVDASNFLSILDSGDRIYIQDETVSGDFVVFDVTGPSVDNTTYWTIPVTSVFEGAFLSNNRDCLVIIQFGGGAGGISHFDLTDIGVNTHAAIDTHIADGTIHFTEASIDHAAIQNIGTNSHAAIDTHIADGTIHFTEGSISHLNIADIGTNSHAAIDTHIADGTIHFTLEAVDDQVDGLLQDVEGLTWAYDDGANTLTPVLDGLLAAYLAVSKSSLIYSDFTSQVTILHEQPFRAIGGSGGTVSANTVDLADHPGIWCLDTGASSVNGRVFLLTSTTNGSWQFGTGNEIRATSWIFGGPFISTALQRYTHRIGFFNITPPNAINNGVGFEYSDDQNGGRWQAITHDGVETSTDTGVTFAVSTWYKMEFIINAAGTSVEFFIDDVSVATNTLNIPTGTGFFHFHSNQIVKTIGLGSRTLYIDATAIYTQVTR
jgi:hypothetical protein